MAKNVQQMIQWTMDDLVGFSHQMKFDVASYSSRILKFIYLIHLLEDGGTSNDSTQNLQVKCVHYY